MQSLMNLFRLDLILEKKAYGNSKLWVELANQYALGIPKDKS